jgi:hypothetical protein
LLIEIRKLPRLGNDGRNGLLYAEVQNSDMHEEVKTIQGSILLKEMAQKAAVLKKKI